MSSVSARPRFGVVIIWFRLRTLTKRKADKPNQEDQREKWP